MSAEYSAIAAKMRAMYANALKDEDFNQLAEKKSVSEICNALKSEKGYEEILEEIDENDAHRGQMEFLLSKALYDDILKIQDFLGNSHKDIVDFFFMRREIEFLKREMHYIFTHEDRDLRSMREAKLTRYEEFFNRHTKIDAAILKNATSLEGCIDACKDTQYADTLTRALNLKADYFMLGMMLDDYYYQRFWRVINSKIPSSERGGFLRLIGSDIDMLNMMWIYRGKKYFNFGNELIFAYLLPVRYRLTEEMTRRLVNADSIETFLNIAAQTPYPELFKLEDDESFIESNYYRAGEKIARSIFSMQTQSLAAVYAYVSLRQNEIIKLTTVIEGVRYGLTPDKIKRFIGTDEKGVE